MDQPSIVNQPHKITSHKSLDNSPSTLSFTPLPSPHTFQFEKTVLSLPKTKVAEQLSLYEWRARTELPIVKVSQYNVVRQT